MDSSLTYRILDANLNRAREGLRVIEEIARFIFDDKNLTLKIKTLRGQLGKAVSSLPREKLLAARESHKDVGRRTYPKTEALRKNLEAICHSNIKRVQEALRVLEEFSKLIDHQTGRARAGPLPKKFKEMRFETYEIEKKLAKALKLDFDLYLVTDPMRDPIESVREAIKGGIKVVQLRDKHTSKKNYLALAKKIRQMTQKAGIKFIVNDHIDIAKKVDADGIHLGQNDPPPSAARKVLGPLKIIGISTHNMEQALKAQKDGADYISVGPIFATPSKPGMKLLGIGTLRSIHKKIKVPIVAIGGINEDNLKQVINIGIKRAAVIRALLQANHLSQKTFSLRQVFQI